MPRGRVLLTTPNLQVHIDLGRAYLEMGLCSDAIAELEAAAEMAPGNEDVLALLIEARREASSRGALS